MTSRRSFDQAPVSLLVCVGAPTVDSSMARFGGSCWICVFVCHRGWRRQWWWSRFRHSFSLIFANSFGTMGHTIPVVLANEEGAASTTHDPVQGLWGPTGNEPRL